MHINSKGNEDKKKMIILTWGQREKKIQTTLKSTPPVRLGFLEEDAFGRTMVIDAEQKKSLENINR